MNIGWDDFHSLIGQKGFVLGHSVISKDTIGQRDLSRQSYTFMAGQPRLVVTVKSDNVFM